MKIRYMVYVAIAFGACSAPTVQQTPEQAKAARQEEAAGGYTADLTKCGVKALYPTFEESKACSAQVRERWHRLPDGGADPAYFSADGGAK